MKLTKILDYLTTFDKEAVKTREILKDLYQSIKREFSQFKKSIKPFCFAEIDEIPMGERLTIKKSKILGKEILEVDLTHNPDHYKRNQIVVKKNCPGLITLIEQYLVKQKIPYHLKEAVI